MTSAREWHVVAFGPTASQPRCEDESDLSAVALRRAVGKIEPCAPARSVDARSCRPQRLRRPSAACARPELESGSLGESRGFGRCPSELRSNAGSSTKLLSRTGLARSLPTRAIRLRGAPPRPGVMPRRGCRDVRSSTARCARVACNADSLAWAHRAYSARLSRAIPRSSRRPNADAMAWGATA
jgi:hypothetical protein